MPNWNSRSFTPRCQSWALIGPMVTIQRPSGLKLLRPRRLGEHRIAVVLPTLTWQAYNLRDDNGDGKGNSWYADWSHKTADLGRPVLSRGVPFGFRAYDLPFLL